MQFWDKLRKSKLLKIFLPIIGLFFVLNQLEAYGLIEDKTRGKIPAPLEAHKRIKRVSASSFPGGGASVVIYKLNRDSITFLNQNKDFLDDWAPRQGCGSAMIFLRDIGKGKDKIVRRYYEGHQVYGQSSMMIIPERGLIMICHANW